MMYLDVNSHLLLRLMPLVTNSWNRLRLQRREEFVFNILSQGRADLIRETTRVTLTMGVGRKPKEIWKKAKRK